MLKDSKLIFTSYKFYVAFLSIIMLSGCISDRQAPTENKQHLHFTRSGVFKFVKVNDGETIGQIAKEHEVKVSEIHEFNRVKPGEDLKKGQVIKVPVQKNTYKIDPEFVYEQEPLKTNEDKKQLRVENEKIQMQEKEELSKKTDNIKLKGNTFKNTTPLSSKNFIWPVEGEVIERYGKHNGKFNEGINIAAPLNSPMKASSDGEVIYVGNQMKAYGNLIIIKHAGDYMTAYAHNNKVMVKKGDRVKKGQVIATVGKSGNVKVPQLHFSIRKGKKTIDPESKN